MMEIQLTATPLGDKIHRRWCFRLDPRRGWRTGLSSEGLMGRGAMERRVLSIQRISSAFLSLFTGAALIVLAPQTASAQLLQGTIDGNVTDSSQAAIVGARVVATNQETNFVRETVTNTAGGYELSGLPPGTYNVAVSSAGFQGYSQ